MGHKLSFAEVDLLEASADSYDSFIPRIFSLRYGGKDIFELKRPVARVTRASAIEPKASRIPSLVRLISS
jgi:hypothetical protein